MCETFFTISVLIPSFPGFATGFAVVLVIGSWLEVISVSVCESVSRSVVSGSLRSHGLQPTRLLCPWDFPGKDTGVGCHSLLQGTFPTQKLNPGLLH